MQRRVEMHRLQDLVRLHRLHTGFREIARMLGMSPNTECAAIATGIEPAIAETPLFDN